MAFTRVTGPRLSIPRGPIGPKGDKPAHEWEGQLLRFENPDGTMGPPAHLGFRPNEVVALIAGRDAFDGEEKGFSVLVEDDATNDNEPTLYFKVSGDNADWSVGITWQPLAAAAVGAFSFTGDGTTTVFDLAPQVPWLADIGEAVNVRWFEAGIYQRPGTDYTVDGTEVTREDAPEDGADIAGFVTVPFETINLASDADLVAPYRLFQDRAGPSATPSAGRAKLEVVDGELRLHVGGIASPYVAPTWYRGDFIVGLEDDWWRIVERHEGGIVTTPEIRFRAGSYEGPLNRRVVPSASLILRPDNGLDKEDVTIRASWHALRGVDFRLANLTLRPLVNDRLAGVQSANMHFLSCDVDASDHTGAGGNLLASQNAYIRIRAESRNSNWLFGEDVDNDGLKFENGTFVDISRAGALNVIMTALGSAAMIAWDHAGVHSSGLVMIGPGKGTGGGTALNARRGSRGDFSSYSISGMGNQGIIAQQSNSKIHLATGEVRDCAIGLVESDGGEIQFMRRITTTGLLLEDNDQDFGVSAAGGVDRFIRVGGAIGGAAPTARLQHESNFVSLPNLPTAAPGTAGRLWRDAADGNRVKVVPPA